MINIVSAKKFVLFLLTMAVLMFPSFIYSQFVTHHNPLFQHNLPKPAKGSTIKQTLFGTNLTRLTDARSEGIPGIVPQYSKRQIWNSDETKMLLMSCNGQMLLYNAATYQFIKVLQGVEGEDVFWSPNDANMIYFAQDSILYSYNINTDTKTTVRVFPAYSFINTRGEGNLSNDGRYYAFVGIVYNYVTGDLKFKDIVVYDIISNAIISTLTLPDTLNDFDWVSISPLGNYVVVDYSTDIQGRYNGVEVYDRNLNFIWQKPLGAGHSDLCLDQTGEESLVIGYYDGDSNKTYLKKFRLSDGKETILLELSPPFDFHISGRNQQRKEWCFVSTFDFLSRLTDDSLSWLPFEDEVFALKLDGSGSVQRLAHHYSRRFSPVTPDPDNSVYFAEPHATVNRTANKIVFGSNWRQKMQEDTSLDAYLVDFSDLVNVNETKVQQKHFELYQNFPNPFNSSTKIRYFIPQGANVKIKVYDILGREIITLAEKYLSAGIHEVLIDIEKINKEKGINLQSGIYFYRIHTDHYSETKKMVYVK